MQKFCKREIYLSCVAQHICDTRYNIEINFSGNRINYNFKRETIINFFKRDSFCNMDKNGTLIMNQNKTN